MREEGEVGSTTRRHHDRGARGALTADEIAQTAEFFSFGTNDLTQMTLGMSREGRPHLRELLAVRVPVARLAAAHQAGGRPADREEKVSEPP